MHIVDQFTRGKAPDQSLNEDRIVVTDDYIAVIDGATPKCCPNINGMSAGKAAAEFTEAAVRALAPVIPAQEAVRAMTQDFRRAVANAISLPTGAEPPTASITIYSRARKEIWRVGDGPFMVDGERFEGQKEIDRINSEARALAIEVAFAQGATLADLAKKDTGRDIIMPILKGQHVFANRPGPYGFGVIDGRDVPGAFIEVVEAGGAREIVLASDGYPRIENTLAASEARLAHILKEDPMLYKLHKSTKGVQTGNLSFDDRTYLKMAR